MKILDDFRYKCQCYYGRIGKKELLKVSLNDGASAMVLYRLAQIFNNSGMGFISLILGALNKLLNGCVIGRNAEFGPGFVLMHPIGVVINGEVVGGKNTVIESGVVIGAYDNGFPVKVPVLGDNIFIGAGAKILGNIKLGNNVKIGANSVVIKDVPDNVTVVGIPGRIVGKRDR